MTKHVKPSRLSICRWFAAAALGCLALNALAAPIPKGGRQPFSVETSGGNLQTYSVMGTAHSGTYFREPIVSVSSPSVSAKVPMPFANKGGQSAEATLTWPVDTQKTTAAAAKALEAGLAGLSSGNGYVAVATVVCAFACQPAIEALTAWGIDQFKKNDDGSLSVDVPDSSVPHSLSDGYYWHATVNPGATRSLSASAVCSRYVDWVNTTSNWTSVTISSCSSDLVVVNVKTNSYSGTRESAIARSSEKSSCLIGSYVVNNQCVAEVPMVSQPLKPTLNQITWAKAGIIIGRASPLALSLLA